MRKAWVRVEQRLDETIAMQFQGRYLRVCRCTPPLRELTSIKNMAAKPPRPTGKPKAKAIG